MDYSYETIIEFCDAENDNGHFLELDFKYMFFILRLGVVENLIWVIEGIYIIMKEKKIPSIEYCCKNLINFSVCNTEKLVCTLNCRKLELCLINSGVMCND